LSQKHVFGKTLSSFLFPFPSKKLFFEGKGDEKSGSLSKCNCFGEGKRVPKKKLSVS